MKKKLTLVVTCVVLVAAMVIGGTLAYFTDTDSKDNTFTAGNVKIELVEKQRNSNSTALVDFENDKVLMPIGGSAQGAKETVDGVELPTAANYIDKIISVKNTGASKAYVRVFVAVPAALQNDKTPNTPSLDVLHFNWNGDSEGEGQWTDEIVVAGNTKIGNIEYRIYSRTYTTALSAQEVTATPAYIGFYLDKGVDMTDDGKYTVDFGKGQGVESINYDLSKGVTIPVFAQAVQADGFANAQAAFAVSGLPSNPWAN